MVFACTMLAIVMNVSAQDDASIRNYIARYRELAMEEQQRSGIPAAITLAQGIHETLAGTSELATQANNHFGIKCKKDWTGETFLHTDNAPNECFRKYPDVESSFRDHSDYLVKSIRYESLFRLSITDYTAWAYGLKQCGYATNPRYAQVLIKYIEDYRLQDYTYAAMSNNRVLQNRYATRQSEIIPEHDPVAIPPSAAQEQNNVAESKPVAEPVQVVKPATPVVAAAPKPAVVAASAPVFNQPNADLPPYGVVVKANGLKAVYAKKGETPLEYAYKYNVRYSRLLEINEIDERPFPQDMFVYLERKNFRGNKPQHKVAAGETLAMISQAEGVQMKYLKSMNLLQENEEPQPGVVLELQRQAAKKPAFYLVTEEMRAKTVIVNAPPKSVLPSTPAKPVTETKPAVVAAPKPATKPQVKADTPKVVVQESVKPAKKPDTVAVTIPERKEAPAPVIKEEIKPQIEEPVVAATIKTEPKPVVVAEPVQTPATPVMNTEQKPSTAVQVAAAQEPPATVETKVEPKQEPVKEAVLPPTTLPAQEKPAVVAANTEAKLPAATLPETKPKNSEPEKPSKPEEPKDELTLLKEKFDKVVYAKQNAKPAQQPAEPVKQEVKTEQVIATPATQPVAAKPTVIIDNVQTLPPSNDPTKYYVVKRGDTAFTIAKAHNITMRQLMNWNGLDFDAIQVGQKLRVKP